MATITGTLQAVDSTHQAFFVGDYIGDLSAVDAVSWASILGRVVGDSTQIPGDSTYVQGSILSPEDLTLVLYDQTFIDGSWSDGAIIAEHISRTYNPVALDYSIWEKDSTQLDGYRYRYATNPQVGYFYANMYAPSVPGNYEIKWQYQKDSDAYFKEVVQPFYVNYWGNEQTSTSDSSDTTDSSSC